VRKQRHAVAHGAVANRAVVVENLAPAFSRLLRERERIDEQGAGFFRGGECRRQVPARQRARDRRPHATSVGEEGARAEGVQLGLVVHVEHGRHDGNHLLRGEEPRAGNQARGHDGSDGSQEPD
jgi:hypothetical protein